MNNEYTFYISKLDFEAFYIDRYIASQFNMLRWTLCLLLLSGFVIDLIVSSTFEGCSLGESLGNGEPTALNLSEFDNNLPKRNEIFRIKQYYNFSEPFFSVHDSSSKTQITFGNHRRRILKNVRNNVYYFYFQLTFKIQRHLLFIRLPRITGLLPTLVIPRKSFLIRRKL